MQIINKEHNFIKEIPSYIITIIRYQFIKYNLQKNTSKCNPKPKKE